jgi:hypothetical protein
MNQRKKRRDEYDGPTVNGHPPLAAVDAQAWFEAADCIVTKEAALPLAQMLNHYEFVGSLWKGTHALREARRRNPTRLRHARIASALKTLQSDLPIVIKNTVRVFPDAQASEQLRPICTLLDCVNSVAPRFEKFRPHRGREPDLWHPVARNIGAKIRDIFRAGNRRAGFTKTTSPAVEILCNALKYLSVSQSPDAIVDAMRKPRSRSRKRVGKIKR